MRVVVTGANRGIGLGLVRVYLGRGDEVHAAARRPESASELQALLGEAAGLLSLHPLDVTDEEACRELARSLEGQPVHLLFNNAGVGGWRDGLDALDMAETLRVLDTNTLGPLRVTRALRQNLAAGPGKVVNVSSTMGSIGDNRSGGSYAYRMSKAALNMASKNLALELAAQGIVVVTVNPGWVRTDMGGPAAPTPVAESAENLARLADRLTPADTGKFLHARGHDLPW
jgi:NAD(P)-dependent dehydrogenase (short-subunit alcohol dehydrogenase family)